MKLKTYIVNLDKIHRRAFIEDDEGIRYARLLPHPDGDPWMDKTGIEIILDKLGIKIEDGKSWEDNGDYFSLELKL